MTPSLTHEEWIACPECQGIGTVLRERYTHQSFDVDSGYIIEEVLDCDNCGGSGQIEADESWNDLENQNGEGQRFVVSAFGNAG